MLYRVNGLKDIHTVLSNERKLGGVVEAEFLRLRTGEEYKNIVITGIDTSGSTIYSVSFVTEEGRRYIVHVNDISLISEAAHKHIKQLNNKDYKKWKTEEKIKFLKKLCELNEGCFTKTFVCEAMQIIEDIGIDAAREYMDVDLFQDNKVVQMERLVS